MYNEDDNNYFKPLIITLLIAVFIMFFTELLSANELHKRDATTVEFRGPFVEGTSAYMESYLKANPETTTVTFKSGGGLLAEGIYLGYLLEEYNITAIVEPKSYCVSACAFAFLGAPNQGVFGVLAFHSPFLMETDSIPDNTVNSNFAQIGGLVLYYIMDQGYHSQLAYLIQTRTDRHTYLVFNNKSDLDVFYVGDSSTPVGKFIEPLNITDAWIDGLIKK